MDNNGLGKSGEFKFAAETPGQQRTKRKKLVQIYITLGTMVGLCLILVTAMIAYGIGFYNGQLDKKSVATSSANNASQSTSETELIPEDTAKLLAQSDVGEGKIPDHYRGNANGKAIAIEYADYTCPYCQSLHKDLNDIYQKYGDRTTFIFRNYEVGHTYSAITARAAEAAYIVGGEDAYWKFGDKLYSDDVWVDGTYMNTDELNNKLKSYAHDIGIDGDKLLDAMNNSANNGIDDKINRDEEMAHKSNVDGTPSWFINRQKVGSTASKITAQLDNVMQ